LRRRRFTILTLQGKKTITPFKEREKVTPLACSCCMGGRRTQQGRGTDLISPKRKVCSYLREVEEVLPCEGEKREN